MRLTGGEGKGRRLADPPKGVRPTSGRLKETLFNMLSNRVREARVLDLYAGSGAFGIEALARGAESAVFLERDRKTLRVIEENLKRCRFESRSSVVAGDVLDLLRFPERIGGPFDLVFADPPYADEAFSEVMRMLREGNFVADDGWVLFEVSARTELTTPPGWKLVKHREVGDSAVSFFSRDEVNTPE